MQAHMHGVSITFRLAQTHGVCMVCTSQLLLSLICHTISITFRHKCYFEERAIVGIWKHWNYFGMI